MKYKTCTDYWLNRDDLSLRGDFEKMYQDIEDPWGCHQGSGSLNNRIFCHLLFDDKKYPSILDIGCGLGDLTDLFRRCNEGGDVTGWDISPTAVEKAQERFSEIRFESKNILTDPIDQKYDLITISEILWYILDDLDDVFKKLRTGLKNGGTLAIHQYFPFEQEFAKEILHQIEGFEDFVEKDKRFAFEQKIVSYVGDDRVLLALLKLKEEA
jgi:SAM-dependent methyltransferase